jgi:hypothetical protein
MFDKIEPTQLDELQASVWALSRQIIAARLSFVTGTAFTLAAYRSNEYIASITKPDAKTTARLKRTVVFS